MEKNNQQYRQTDSACYAKACKRTLLAVLLCISLFMLSACGGPSLEGTWLTSDSGMQESSLTFNKGTMTMSADGFSISGEYEAKDGQLTYTLVNPFTEQPETVTQAYTIEKDVLTMGGINYTRAK